MASSEATAPHVLHLQLCLGQDIVDLSWLNSMSFRRKPVPLRLVLLEHRLKLRLGRQRIRDETSLVQVLLALRVELPVLDARNIHFLAAIKFLAGLASTCLSNRRDRNLVNLVIRRFGNGEGPGHRLETEVRFLWKIPAARRLRLGRLEDHVSISAIDAQAG